MTATAPSGRPLESMDVCAPVSLARQFRAALAAALAQQGGEGGK